jgi:hypothetical protein
MREVGNEPVAPPAAMEPGDPIASPAEALKNALRTFILAVRVHEAFLNDRIDPAKFGWHEVRMYTENVPRSDEKPGLVIQPMRYTKAGMAVDTINLLYSTAGHLAIVAYEAALDCGFRDDKKKVADYDDDDRIIEIMCQMRHAFAHGPQAPKWHVTSSARRNRYVLKVSNRQIDIDFAVLNGKNVKPIDYGGWEGLLLMALQIQTRVQQHVASHPKQKYKRYGG